MPTSQVFDKNSHQIASKFAVTSEAGRSCTGEFRLFAKSVEKHISELLVVAAPAVRMPARREVDGTGHEQDLTLPRRLPCRLQVLE